MKSTAIIPCYFVNERLKRITLAYLSSLHYGKPDEVIVVDDASPLPAPEVKNHKFVDKYIRRSQNGGYGASINTGAKAASGDILIMCNNDLVFSPKWLDGLLSPIHEGYDISLIRVSDADPYDTEDKITENDYFGSCWAITKNAWDKLGELDESLGKGYFEDIDYRRRALAKGLKIGKNHGTLVEHIGKATFSTIDPLDKIHDKAKKLYEAKWKLLK